jgi:hypothetical protein
LKKALQQIDDSHPAGTVAHHFYEETNLYMEYKHKARSYPRHHRYCVDDSFLKNDADVVEILEKAFTTLPNKKSLVLWNTMVPHSQSELPDMALSIHSDHYFAMYGICEDEGEYPGCESWVREVMTDVSKHEIGVYLGEFDPQARRSQVWGKEHTKRLMDIRRQWDPKARFCNYLGFDNLDTNESAVKVIDKSP